MSFLRPVGLLALGVVVVGSLGFGFAAPAEAVAATSGLTLATGASVAVGMPGPLNILPDLVVGAKAAVSSPEALMAMLLPNIKDGTLVRALYDASLGTASATETAAVATEAASFAVPMTAAAPLAAVIGGASVLVAGLETGLLMGNAGARMFGFKDDEVCSQQNGVLSVVSAITNGVNCDAYNSLLTQAQQNLDQAPKLATSSICYQAWCASYLGTVLDHGQEFCFAVSNGGPAGWSRYALSVDLSDGSQANVGAGSGYGNCTFAIPSGSGGTAAGWRTLGTSIKDYVLSYLNGSSQVMGSATHTVTAAEISRANPTRVLDCKITATDGTTTTATSNPFLQTDAAMAPIVCPAASPTKVPSTTTVTSRPLDGSAPSTQLQNQPVTPQYQNLLTNFPQCVSGKCLVDLLKNGQSCFSQVGLCANWFTDPNKASTMQCQYNGVVVDLTECNAYSPRFNPENVATGLTLADPSTGLAVKVPAQAPLGTIAPGSTLGDPAASRVCIPQGWGVFNPIEWVMKPVGCALEAAFVPRASDIQADDNKMKANIQASALGSAAVIGAAVVAFPVVSTGCGGIPWTFAIYTLSVDASLLNSCPGQPLHDISVQVRSIVVATLWTTAALAWIRYIAVIFGYTGFGSGTSSAAESSGGLRDLGELRVTGSVGRSSRKAIES